RKLAKLGVNMVRFHSPLVDFNADRVNEKELDNLFYLVSAMKRQGIYTTFSFYFPLWFDVQPGSGLEGYDRATDRKPMALLYFDPRMQEKHRSWAKSLLTAKNPYTNLSLAQDPAVGIVEIINEDSLFFWTFTKKNVPPVQWEKFEKLYGQW